MSGQRNGNCLFKTFHISTALEESPPPRDRNTLASSMGYGTSQVPQEHCISPLATRSNDSDLQTPRGALPGEVINFLCFREGSK